MQANAVALTQEDSIAGRSAVSAKPTLERPFESKGERHELAAYCPTPMPAGDPKLPFRLATPQRPLRMCKRRALLNHVIGSMHSNV
ncbi:hypothetical protein BN2476_1410003 [Paraburkholderia piptadeniae]|uniref:Uncharacterized protein n=1 Tax=Paraburkholderia piptadeniae TaxID=1701573 RepID=A0A1N7SWQ2_9BURK|nr:hypothetical protein BN2476_1410003 [Paraburkholderia piptadeniae]